MDKIFRFVNSAYESARILNVSNGVVIVVIVEEQSQSKMLLEVFFPE